MTMLGKSMRVGVSAWQRGAPATRGGELNTHQIATGCYEIAGTSVNLRESGNINQIKGSLNTPDQVYVDGYTRNFYVPEGNVSVFHTFARVMVTSGPYRDSSGWVAVEYLRPCTGPVVSEASQGMKLSTPRAEAIDARQRGYALQARPAVAPTSATPGDEKGSMTMLGKSMRAGAEKGSMTMLGKSMRAGTGAMFPRMLQSRRQAPLRCPPGYGYYYIVNGDVYAGPYSAPVLPQHYDTEGRAIPVFPGSWQCRPLWSSVAVPTASQALTRVLREQAMPGTQPSMYGGRPPERRITYQVRALGADVDQLQQGEGDMSQAMQRYDDANLVQFAAGLGASMNRVGPEGFGAIGNIGNRDTLDPGKYEVSGDGVNVRPQPSFSVAPKTTLNTGDVVQATGQVASDASPGTDANFPKGVSVNFAEIIGPTQGWIAVGYLDRLGTGRVSQTKGAQPPPVTGMVKSKMDPTTLALIAAGVLGVGIVGYAVYRSQKKGKARAA